VRLVFAGTPATALVPLEALLASRHQVVGVVTRPDARSGRGRRLQPSPVAERADKDGVEVLKPASAKDPEFLERLRSLAPDCCPVVAFGALVPRVALDIPPHGWINLHFSLLPAWRGAAPVQHAILHGDEITGAATFRLEEGLDTGPIYGVVTEPIRPDDTSGELLERLSHSGARLLVETLDGIESGELEPRPQPAEGISYAAKITPEDARIDWEKPAAHIERLIRACTPAPGPWTTFRGQRLKLGPIKPTSIRSATRGLGPGQLWSAAGSAVYAGTGTNVIQLSTVMPEGKRRMSAADWARGARLARDERLV
jgi:methionyl-tRNA formyltransferase